MLDFEKFWRDSPSSQAICTTTKATKNMVLNAIMEGARDLESLKKTVPLCADNKCSMVNTSGRGCIENAEMLLSIYVPIYELMMEGGGCHHEHKPQVTPTDQSECGKKDTNDCGSCNLCKDN